MTKRQTFVIIAAMVATAIAGRLLPHMPNFAPVTATALFCGAYMSKRQSLVGLAVIMLASDYMLLYIKPFGGTSFDHLYARGSCITAICRSFTRPSACLRWWAGG